MQKTRIIGTAVSLMLLSAPCNAQSIRESLKEANGIIERFSKGAIPIHSNISLHKNITGCDSFTTQVSNGTLELKASNGVSLCRAFYDYTRRHQIGIKSWSGSRFEKVNLKDEPLHAVCSPYRDHYYMNVVMYGYTLPYWDQKRWDQEIDWMALHGVDMPMMLVASEAIMRRAFKRVGLTDKEMDEYFVGPAHLPWMRMGNMSGGQYDGPLSKKWHKSQIKLAHHLLDRMRKLGMKPICPAFAGFVPQSIKNHYPDAKIEKTLWAGDMYNFRLDPSDQLFYRIGTAFIEEWEKEFGKCDLYLSDSFNEMSIPDDLNKLSDYGTKIFNSIHDVNPDAKWVLQGWMFGFQRNNWNTKTVPALFKDVPDDKLLILDMATDYNRHFWHNGYDWDVFDGFYGKEWVWSVIPNMGGKTQPTGVLEYYANGRLDALNSPNKGNLIGYGFAPEGVENNEIIYELITDGGWTDQPIDLQEWLKNYSMCRYGSYTQNLNRYYQHMCKSVYGSFTDHPRFSWQFRPSDHPSGSVNICREFFNSAEEILKDAPQAKNNDLYRYDMIEAVAMYTSAKLQLLVAEINTLLQKGDKTQAANKIEVFKDLMLDLDALLECHPLYRLDRFEQFAKDMASNEEERIRYAKNARRLVSIWEYKNAESLQDYSAHIWSGLIRDYYLPRWEIYYKNKLNGTKDSVVEYENKWVNEYLPLTEARKIDNPMEACLALYRKAKEAVKMDTKVAEIKFSNDKQSYWYLVRSAYENTKNCVLTDSEKEGAHLQGLPCVMSGQQMWRFIPTGITTCRMESRYGHSISSDGTVAPSVTSGNKDIDIVLRAEDKGEWNIYPGVQTNMGLHMAGPGKIIVWTASSDIRGSRWILEPVDEAMVPEPVGEDYDRLIAELENLRKEVGTKPGQICDSADIDKAISTVQKWANDISHISFGKFLQKKAELLKSLKRWPNK